MRDAKCRDTNEHPNVRALRDGEQAPNENACTSEFLFPKGGKEEFRVAFGGKGLVGFQPHRKRPWG